MSASGKKLITRFAERFGVDEKKFYETLKATAFKQRDGSAPTDEQMLTLLVVADQYNLNPFTREIYAFPDKNNGIVPVVGVDGWSRIINEHPQYDGIEFVYSDTLVRPEGARVDCPEWIECVIYRKDRSRPIRIKEFLDEVYRPPFQGSGRNGSYTVEGPWQTHPKRFLRHKGMVQCARVAFGFVGIYDQDEAERIVDMGEAIVINPTVAQLPSATTRQRSNGQSGQPLAIDHKKIDPLLHKLVERAIKQNAWGTAHDYVAQRFSGDELTYATQYLSNAELEQVSSPSSNGEAKGTSPKEPEVQAVSDVEHEEVPLPTEADIPPMLDEGDPQGSFY